VTQWNFEISVFVSSFFFPLSLLFLHACLADAIRFLLSLAEHQKQISAVCTSWG